MFSTKITHIASLLRRAGILTAIGTASLAVAAAPASAQPPRKVKEVKTCKLEVGNVIYEYGEGSKVTVTAPDGSKDTYTCKEGKWVKTARVELGGSIVPVGSLQGSVQEGGTSPTSPTTGAVAPVGNVAALE